MASSRRARRVLRTRSQIASSCAYRVNDSLPGEEAKSPRWRWELGGWLEVDRVTGRVSALNLPEFDASTSSASWYREYAGHCGVSDDGKKLHAVVVILGRCKPIVKALLGDATSAAEKPTAPHPLGNDSRLGSRLRPVRARLHISFGDMRLTWCLKKWRKTCRQSKGG